MAVTKDVRREKIGNDCFLAVLAGPIQAKPPSSLRAEHRDFVSVAEALTQLELTLSREEPALVRGLMLKKPKMFSKPI